MCSFQVSTKNAEPKVIEKCEEILKTRKIQL